MSLWTSSRVRPKTTESSLYRHFLAVCSKSLSRSGRRRRVRRNSSRLALTVLMILYIRFWNTFPLGKAMLMTCYGFAPVIFSVFICIFRFDAFLKTGICTALNAVMLYFANFVAEKLFGPSDSNLKIDFNNWEECLNGNINFICLVSLLFISVVFFGIGIYRTRKINR